MVKPVMDALTARGNKNKNTNRVVVGHGGDGEVESMVELHFCVDEMAQQARVMAEHVAAEGVYALEWCVGAMEAGEGDLATAREWLENWAPKMKKN